MFQKFSSKILPFSFIFLFLLINLNFGKEVFANEKYSPNFSKVIFDSKVYSEQIVKFSGKEHKITEIKEYRVWFNLMANKRDYKFRMKLKEGKQAMIFDSTKYKSDMLIYTEGKKEAIKFPVFPFQIGILVSKLSSGPPLKFKKKEKVEKIPCNLYEYYQNKKLAGKIWAMPDKGFIIKWEILAKKKIIVITNSNPVFDADLPDDLFSLPPDVKITTFEEQIKAAEKKLKKK